MTRYGQCLKLLDQMKDNLLLDVYLAPHIHTLFSMIRNRGLVQYFSPYLSADLAKMSASFNTTIPGLVSWNIAYVAVEPDEWILSLSQSP